MSSRSNIKKTIRSYDEPLVLSEPGSLGFYNFQENCVLKVTCIIGDGTNYNMILSKTSNLQQALHIEAPNSETVALNTNAITINEGLPRLYSTREKLTTDIVSFKIEERKVFTERGDVVFVFSERVKVLFLWLLGSKLTIYFTNTSTRNDYTNTSSFSYSLPTNATKVLITPTISSVSDLLVPLGSVTIAPRVYKPPILFF